MKASRFTEEPIVRAFKEVEMAGKTAVEQQRELQVSNATGTSGNENIVD